MSEQTRGAVAVTGVAGRVGAAVAAELSVCGYQVRGFRHRCNNSSPATSIDVTRPESLRGCFDGCRWLVHCAGSFHGDGQQLALVNVDGTRNVAAVAATAGVRYFVLISTATAGGGVAHPDPYVRSKSEAEQALRDCGLPTAAAVRAGWVIRPADREAYAKLWPPSTRQVVLSGARVPIIALRDLSRLVRIAVDREIAGAIEGFTASPTQEELVDYAEAISGRHRKVVATTDVRLLKRLAGMRRESHHVYRDTYLTGTSTEDDDAVSARVLVPDHAAWQDVIAELYVSLDPTGCLQW
jgi:nucleoside-diphosphate-sugar epimerase